MPPTLKSINIFYMKQAVRLFTLGCLVAFLVPSFAQEIKRKHIDHGIDPEQTGYVRCATPDPPQSLKNGSILLRIDSLTPLGKIRCIVSL